MKLILITLFPEMIQNAISYGVLGQALKKNLLEVQTVNPRAFAVDNHKTVDDRPFGGSDGMLLQAPILKQCLQSVVSENPGAKVILLSPQGKTLDENKVKELAQHKSLILISARYAGIDQRFINQYVNEELSIGDYVLSGGELPALVLLDAVSRKIPGVLGHQDSADKDSFAQGLLEAPLFTRPQDWEGEKVPSILLSGHHQKVDLWNEMMAWLVTRQKRPDLFEKAIARMKESQGAEAVGQHLAELEKFYQTQDPAELESCGLTGISDV